MIEWLPNPLVDPPCDIASRYELFLRDYIEDPPSRFAPREFRVASQESDDGRLEIFHHLVTTGEPPNRTHDPYRCRRIHWGKPVIESTMEARTVSWRTRQHGEWRIKFSLPDYSYLVVLGEDNVSVRLVTAFWVHTNSGREKLRREHLRSAEEF